VRGSGPLQVSPTTVQVKNALKKRGIARAFTRAFSGKRSAKREKRGPGQWGCPPLWGKPFFERCFKARPRKHEKPPRCRALGSPGLRKRKKLTGRARSGEGGSKQKKNTKKEKKGKKGTRGKETVWGVWNSVKTGNGGGGRGKGDGGKQKAQKISILLGYG